MQGERNAIGSFPGALNLEHGSTSSDAGSDQQLCWNSMQSSRQNLSGWNVGEPSSHAIENPNGHHERKAENGWSAQMFACGAVGLDLEQRLCEPDNILDLNNASVNCTINLLSNTPSFLQNLSNGISQDLNTSAEFLGKGNDCSAEQEISQLLFASSSSETFVAPSERDGFLVEENDARPSHPLDGRRLSCKRKVVDRNTAQSSISGSSSCFQHAESTVWNSVPGRYDAGSSLSISTPSENMVAVSESPAASESLLALNLARNTERSQRIYRARTNPSLYQDSVPINIFPMGSTVGHSNVASQPQLSRLITLNNSLQMRPLSVADNTSSQTQSTGMHVPAFRPIPRVSRWNGGFIPRHNHSSSSGDVSIMPNEESNSISMPRNVSEHPMFVPANERRNSAQNSANWSLAGRNTSMSGNVSSTSRIGSRSRVHQLSGPNRLPHRNPPHPVRLSDLVPRSLLSSADAASGGQSSINPSLQETELSFEEGNEGHHLSLSRARVLLDRQLDSALEISHSLQTLAAVSEGRSRLVSEIRGVLDLMRRGEGLLIEDVMMLGQSLFSGRGNTPDRHRGMRLDVDNMSYEELLALEEHIGNVSTGLSEETILKGLKQQQRKCSSITRVTCCAVCQEEYNEGEHIGILTCGHEFHTPCIKQWLMHKNLCPICKTTALNT